jgi:hypothetical protein
LREMIHDAGRESIEEASIKGSKEDDWEKYVV